MCYSENMNLFEGLTSVAKVLREADKIEQYQLILDAQKALLDDQKIIRELEDEVKRLKDIADFKREANFENNCYWLKKEDRIDGPFCSKCVETDDKIVRLHVTQSEGYATCPNCKNSIFSRGEPVYNNFRDDDRGSYFM